MAVNLHSAIRMENFVQPKTVVLNVTPITSWIGYSPAYLSAALKLFYPYNHNFGELAQLVRATES